MKNIKILDCTLRDGGYINVWNFGEPTIKSITHKLEAAAIDIIEVGFMTEKSQDENYTLFSSTEEVEQIMPATHNSMYVGMIAIGEKEIHPSKLADYDGKSIDGIRLTFHQNEVDKAIEWATIIKEKGYKVFMQPVGTIFYTDAELLALIERVNDLNPYAFYIVDTLGSMYRNKLLYMFYLVDSNLNSDIKIGFHAHNNLQLAFSNAQELSRIHTTRTLILDSSVYGMGRGAGNLPTELITQYINDNIEKKYDTTTILDIYDENISLIREEYEWGYSVPYDIAASYVCHPNYATYLLNKQTLIMKNIEEIIRSIPKEERPIYNKKLIEELYIEYQNKKIDDKDAVEKIRSLASDKKILVLAPGKTLVSEFDVIQRYIDELDPYIISVNFLDQKFHVDACFVSNQKRIESIKNEHKKLPDSLIISTSNIGNINNNDNLCVDYYSYTNQDEVVFDNAGLMLFKLLIQCGVSEITLAGFDGFKTRYNENYYNDKLNIPVDENELKDKQERIKSQIQELGKKLKINFLTPSVYEENE